MGLWKKLTTPIGEQHPEWQDKINEKFDNMNAKLESNRDVQENTKSEQQQAVQNRKEALEKRKAERKGHYSECPNCGGTNFTYQFIQTEQNQKSKGEFKKKSLVARTGNKTGRAFANMATLGAYGAVTSKRSDYKNVNNAKTSIKNVKMAICQDCGNSWEVK
ncbi:MAG: hypothetical protein ACLRZ9_13030 [Eubacterium sp.]